MDTIKINKYNTKMIAHMGLSGLEPANTCAAFIAAGNRDYYGMETDMHPTSDGRFIIIHDTEIYPQDPVTKEISKELVNVDESEFDYLRSISLKDDNGEFRVDLRMPSLEEYLGILARYDKVGVLEFKYRFNEEQLRKILELVNKYHSLDKMIFISFFYDPLCRLRELSPEANIQLLSGEKITQDLIDRLKAYNLDLDGYHENLTKENIEWLHSCGITVNCYTVDDPARAEDLAKWGVDYITSDILQ